VDQLHVCGYEERMLNNPRPLGFGAPGSIVTKSSITHGFIGKKLTKPDRSTSAWISLPVYQDAPPDGSGGR